LFTLFTSVVLNPSCHVPPSFPRTFSLLCLMVIINKILVLSYLFKWALYPVWHWKHYIWVTIYNREREKKAKYFTKQTRKL
jgi:hypothetical protein